MSFTLSKTASYIDSLIGLRNVFIGDKTGTTDVSAALTAAIQASGKNTLFIPDGAYRLSASVNAVCDKNVKFLCDVNVKPISTDYQSTYVTTGATQVAVTSITKELAADFGSAPDFVNDGTSDYVHVLNVASSAAFAVEDIVVVSSSDIHPAGGSRRMGEAIKVRWVSTGKIFLSGLLAQDVSYYTTNVTAAKYKRDRTFRWTGGTFSRNGDWKDTTIDLTLGEHAHSMIVRNFCEPIIEDVIFDGVFEGGLELFNCPLAKVRNIKALRLPNTNTSSVSWNGLLGYGVQVYGHCYGSHIDGVYASEGRHAVTTDGNGDSTYTDGEWYRRGQPTHVSCTNIKSVGAYGVPIDTHEEGSYISFTNIEVIEPMQGPFWGSYNGFGLQIRASNVSVKGYHQVGGYGGLRYANSAKLINSITLFENIEVRNLRDSPAGSSAIIVDNISGTTAANRGKIVISGLLTDNVPIPIQLSGGADVVASGLKMFDIGQYGIQSSTAANSFIATDCFFDFTGNPFAKTSQTPGRLTTTGDFMHLGNVTIVMGATTAAPPRVFFTNTAVATQQCGYSKLTLIDKSGVGKLEAVTAAQASNMPWIGSADVIEIPLVDSATTLTTGTTAEYIFPSRFQILDFMASNKTASSSGNPTFDILKNGSTMMGTNKLSIDATEKSSLTAATPYSAHVTGSSSTAATAMSMMARGDALTVTCSVAGTGTVGATIFVRGFWC